MAQAQQTIRKDDRSLGDLFTELANETGTLIRQEVALAQTEISRKVSRVGMQVGYLAIGGAIGLLAALSLFTALIVGLGQLIANVANVSPLTGVFLSSLIVGIAVACVAAFLITSALKKLRETDLTPHQTVKSLKEDAQWLKDQVS